MMKWLVIQGVLPFLSNVSYLEFSIFIIAPLMLAAGIIGAYFLNYYITVVNVANVLLIYSINNNYRMTKKKIIKELPSHPYIFSIIYVILIITIFLLVLFNEGIIDSIAAIIFIFIINGVLLKLFPKLGSAHFLKKIKSNLKKRLLTYQQQGDLEKVSLSSEMIHIFDEIY